MGKLKLAVLVISIGERPFSTLTLESIKAYADRIGADLLVERKTSIPLKLWLKCKFIKFKRERIECYLQKMIKIHDALEDFDRVLLLDDSCLVSSKAPNIFEEVSIDEIGAFPESECMEFKAPSYDKKFIFEKKNVSIDEYYNTGVLVVSKEQKELFSPQRLLTHLILFKSLYPDQAYFAYATHIMKTKVKKLSTKWNFMPVFDYSDNNNRRLVSLSEEHLKVVEQQNIVHVTGYYENRGKIIEQIYYFEQSSPKSNLTY